MSPLDTGDPQAAVTAYFQRDAPFWKTLYQGDDVFSVIHQHRAAVAMHWIEGLGLPPAARVLEVGCGAGSFAVELARRGLLVAATDAATAMLRMTRSRARQAGLEEKLTTAVLDVHRLAFASSSFDLVVALGVIPWLHSPELAIREMARVLIPGGHLVVNADNRGRLIHLVDPLTNPFLAPARWALNRFTRRLRPIRAAHPNTIWPRMFDRLLASVGVEKREELTFGFGPFTFLGRKVFSERTAVGLHGRLQQLADGRVPLLRGLGAQYMVLARKRTLR